MRKATMLQVFIWLCVFEGGRFLWESMARAGITGLEAWSAMAVYAVVAGAFGLLLEFIVEMVAQSRNTKRYLAPDGVAYTREELRRAYWSDEQIDELEVVGRGRS